MHARPRARRDRDLSWTRDPASMRSNTAAVAYLRYTYTHARDRDAPRRYPISRRRSRPAPSRRYRVGRATRRYRVDRATPLDAGRRRIRHPTTSDIRRRPTTSDDDDGSRRRARDAANRDDAGDGSRRRARAPGASGTLRVNRFVRASV